MEAIYGLAASKRLLQDEDALFVVDAEKPACYAAGGRPREGGWLWMVPIEADKSTRRRLRRWRTERARAAWLIELVSVFMPEASAALGFGLKMLGLAALESLAPGRVWLYVPRGEYRDAAQLGAKRDRATGRFYVEAGADLSLFARWLSAGMMRKVANDEQRIRARNKVVGAVALADVRKVPIGQAGVAFMPPIEEPPATVEVVDARPGRREERSR